MPKRLTILGSTGTIGKNTIKLVQENQGFEIEALVAHSNVNALAKQAIELNAKIAVIENESHYSTLKELLAGTNIEAASGKQAVIDAASRPVDVVMSGIVGAAALAPTLAAIRAGTTIGLANKECLVCAGDLVTDEAKKHGSKLIPVDSEHNALYQCFEENQQKAVDRITLTASGGPFRTKPLSEFSTITVEQAVAHPNWTMGAKISVDSATMMNKGLEVIEAYHLFPIEKDQIDVVVHPQSIIHGTVSYTDGSMLAGLSIPDMCVPISYALGWPNRLPHTQTKRLDLTEIGQLTFEAPDFEKFPALKLAMETLKVGGAAPCILNAANEIAVQAFLDKKISFLSVTSVVKATLEEMSGMRIDNLDDVYVIDKQARFSANSHVNKMTL